MQNIWEKELTFPEDVYYSQELLWAKDLGENKVRMGISDLGVKSVKSLIHVRLITSVGTEIKKGDTLGFVETSKMVWEIVTPLSGKLVVKNAVLSSGNPAKLVKDPYGEGWLVEIEKTSDTEGELKGLHKGDDPATKTWIREMAEAIVPLKVDE